MQRLRLIVTGLLLVFGLGIVQPAIAQTADDGALRLETSPLPINLTTTPGQSVSSTLRVRNDGTQTEHLKVGLLTFTANDKTGTPTLRERRPGDDFFDWVTFSQDQLTVAPNSWQEVKMTINPPPSAALGYYYAVTFSRAGEQQATLDRQNTLLGAAATLVLLDVEVPGAKRQVKVEQFSVDRPWYEFLPVNFTVSLRNTGNIQVVASGNIFISEGSQQNLAALNVNQGKGNILPKTTRNFTASWTDGFPVYRPQVSNKAVVHDSQGQAVQELHWDISQANKLRFGHYTAHLLLAYTDHGHDVPVAATTSFWVIPWRLLVAGLLIILFGLIGIASTGRLLWRAVRSRR